MYFIIRGGILSKVVQIINLKYVLLHARENT